jgi:hypothetical protein
MKIGAVAKYTDTRASDGMQRLLEKSTQCRCIKLDDCGRMMLAPARSMPTKLTSCFLLSLMLWSGYKPSVAAEPVDESPLGVIERLHQAMRDADAKTADRLLHASYQGLSLQGAKESRHVFVETRDRAVGDIAKLKPGEWEVRFLSTATRVDRNGLAHVWARYVFLYKGTPNHCGYESYGLLKTPEGWKIISFADTDNPLNGKSADEVCPKS